MLYSPAPMLDLTKIKAISLDLDDTLWPIWPTIERAEIQLQHWLAQHAPLTAAAFADPAHRVALREAVLRAQPAISHDMSALRREMIRSGLQQGGEDPDLAEPAFDVFFAHRMRVDLYADALPALRFLAARFPLVAISNGNADLARVGIGEHFHASLSAHLFGVGKPDARIFHAAASAAGVPPQAVLHIGDDARLDVLGALDAGMQTVWLNRGGHPWDHRQQPHFSVASLDPVCQLFA
ncbi:MAG: HAD family hydrolase [Burkholderiaceae bacterium]